MDKNKRVESYSRCQLLQQDTVYHKAGNLHNDQDCQHHQGKVLELCDWTLGSRSVEKLVQLSELLCPGKLLMPLVIHLQSGFMVLSTQINVVAAL